jgi:topoisomerase-4 subunit B
MADLFQSAAKRKSADYSARDIEVLEGLEPVRRRPAMYIGGADEHGLHHLFAEVLDNAMDEAVAGHADRIEVELAADGALSVADNGRGIPIDRHPKFKDKTALEVILTTLHSGGKFSDKVYQTAGGLHGVGLSVVNALASRLTVEVARDRVAWRQTFERGVPVTKLKKVGPVNRRGTTVIFSPDPKIFGANVAFRPARLFRMARSKAYLFPGVEIRWKCAEKLLKGDTATPPQASLHFPGGLEDFLGESLEGRACVTPSPFVGRVALDSDKGRIEWAISWRQDGEGSFASYCNTVSTPQGGAHETGLRNALLRGLKSYGELTGNRRVGLLTGEDILGGASVMLSVFIRNPQFQGQTKERLVSPEATKLVETVLKDHFEHWLTAAPDAAQLLVDHVLARAEERIARKQEKETSRQSPTRKLRLPGKLADCARAGAQGTELFIVEGDSAGGSAKQARRRDSQAVLPLRGKILNVAAAASGKLAANQELSDLVKVLGCGSGERYDDAALRYEKIIIMTDADVDGAHIASLLMTFFYRELPKLIDHGHLYLAQPPLYRLSQGAKTIYARDDAHKDKLIATQFDKRGKIDVSRFKGLGEMPSVQLRETTMDPRSRILLKIKVAKQDRAETDQLVESLMGRKPELRFRFIQERAEFAGDLDI